MATSDANAVGRNVSFSHQHHELIKQIAARREISFSAALRRLLDQWQDMHEDGVVSKP